MTSSEPPRLPLALLERFVPESAPLAGDLIEEFHRRQSVSWLWWQVVVVIANASFTRTDEIRLLRLVNVQPADALERTRDMSRRFRAVNLTASPVYGIGGLGLVVLALLVTLVAPGAWVVLPVSMLAGVLLGIVMIASEGGSREALRVVEKTSNLVARVEERR